MLSSGAQWNILWEQHIAGGEDTGPLNRVFQFANISWPRIFLHQFYRIFREFELGQMLLGRDLFQKIFSQQVDILSPLSERRQVDPDHIQTIKEIFPKLFATGDTPSLIMEREGLKQISDTGALERIIADVIAANPKQVEQYKSGKTTVINYLVGQAMKATRGQANVAAVTDLLKQKLG